MKKTTATVAALLCATASFANPYEKYEGTTLVVSWPALAHFSAAEALVDEFTEETGIEVEIDALQYLKLRDRQILEMSKPEGEYDVVSWVVMWKGEYVSKGLLTPLSQYFTSGSLVDPQYDIDDVAGAYLQNGGVVGGKKGYMPGVSGALYGIPFGAETSILAYRKDIFEEQGIEVPTTYDELAAAMTKLHDAGIPALTSRGKTGHQVTAGWLLHLAPLGGKIFDDEWNPVVNSPEAVKAAEFMRHVAKTGPVGIETFGFGEAAAAFLQGDAAMHLDTLKIAAMSRNPNLSKIDGKVGYALHPVGTRCGSETGGFAMGIPANAPNREAAFLFIQYMTNKAGDQRMVELGGDPVRISTLQNNTEGFDDYPIVAEQLPCADPDWRPLIPEWNEINIDVLGQALTQVITTDDPIQPIMDKANEELRAIMEREGYYTWADYRAAQ
ncbi:MAG: extracellular solute-binding protein [Boseongicola sp. SB0676_bin_33]|nr:extracellular solute-binding protein [Boseongicola sp. SB0667_bin_21]MYF89637.1 extracellular solute-binding protein [Boseongicola sp. SB0676_bin_33]MYK31140.1 extracellular solute-binding protein [Boseongicola sp. SB0670_bin_30]